jgi:hypothetical protein
MNRFFRLLFTECGQQFNEMLFNLPLSLPPRSKEFQKDSKLLKTRKYTKKSQYEDETESLEVKRNFFANRTRMLDENEFKVIVKFRTK